MGEAKFTKGEWYWLWDDCDCEYPCNHGKYATSLRSKYSDGSTTPVIYSIEDMNDLDAHLIACAPKLYEEIERDIEHLRVRSRNATGDLKLRLVCEMDRKIRLLAKARGEHG